MTESTTTPTPLVGKWSEQRNKLKAKFSTLTDEDLQYQEGKKDEMLNKLQAKLGKTKEELAAIISTL